MSPRRLVARLVHLRRDVTRWIRARVFALARIQRRYVHVRVGGAVYVLSTRDRGVSAKVYATRRRPEFGVLERALRMVGPVPPGAIFVDVGANIGTTTIPALLDHGFASAVACEPGEVAADLLRRTVAANGLDRRVTIVGAAVSDTEGTIHLRMPNPDSGTLEAGAPVGELLEVATVTLDGLAERGVYEPGSVGLVWVDAQGHEGHILSGAGRLLARSVPLVVALRPKKLRRGLGLDRYLELLQRHYARVADLRDPGAGLEPVQAIRRFAEENRKTDLLLIGR
jgi:FkbM family methyltransferase